MTAGKLQPLTAFPLTVRRGACAVLPDIDDA